MQQALVARTRGIRGTFQWAIQRGNQFADFGGNATAVGANVTLRSKLGSAAQNDVEVRVQFTGAAAQTGQASRNFTVRRPDRLSLLRNQDLAHRRWGYESRVHYRIQDQFGRALPRDVNINEQFTAAPTADFAGMNWRASTNRPALVDPADWFDRIQGEGAGFNPVPVRPSDPNASVPVYHWPGIWRVGSRVIGRGRQVASVIWQKFRGRARHR